jgi:hypothetical protein
MGNHFSSNSLIPVLAKKKQQEEEKEKEKEKAY